MKKTLTSSGNGWELYLNTPIIKLIGLTPTKDKIALMMKKNVLFLEKYEENNIEQNKLIKKLAKRGGGWALFMPLPILDLMGITNPDTDFIEIEVDENKLSIKKTL